MKMSRTLMNVCIVSKIPYNSHGCSTSYLAFEICLFALKLWSLILYIVSSEHTQDKDIQRDDEYYDGDNDNGPNMEDAQN